MGRGAGLESSSVRIPEPLHRAMVVKCLRARPENNLASAARPP